MPFSLLDQPWIPVRRADGALLRIPPWRITDCERRESFIEVMSPRPDFDGACLEFLIGLVQTALTPADEDEWFERWDTPPTPDQLREAFTPYREAFFLDGDGPRFMQDPTALTAENDVKPISWLFMDGPSDNTEKENRDLFIKRRGFERLCPGCAGTALFALQVFASSGGRGHYSSIRGKGPLSTVVLGRDLWQTVWANVLSRSQLQAQGKPSSPVLFPWMAKRGRRVESQVMPNQVHPVYRYWGMPRRVWLVFRESASSCDLCGQKSKLAVGEYAAQPNGNKYQGPWRHPLTPYRTLQDKTPLPIEGRMDGARYRHWLGITLGEQSGKLRTEPAQVVRVFASRSKELGGDQPDFRIRAYGYEMDNMKARGYCLGEMPAWSLTESKMREAFAFEVQRLISAADYVADRLKMCLFDALVHKHRGGSQRKQLARRTFFGAVVTKFWAATEPTFYTLLLGLHKAAREHGDTFPIRLEWQRCLGAAAMGLFEESTGSVNLGGGDIKRVARAQRALRFAVGPWSKEMQKRLDLPPPQPAPAHVPDGGST